MSEAPSQGSIAVDDETASALALCREALSNPLFTGLDARIANAPRNAEGWFEMLRGFPHDPHSYAFLAGLQKALPPESTAAGVSAGHYAALSALPVAATRFMQAPVPLSVKRLYAAMIRDIATRAKHWEAHFDVEGSRFHDVAHLVSLRRYPAGEVGFEIGKRFSIFLSLRLHPLDWPGFAAVAVPTLGRTLGPVCSLHFNYARQNWLVLPQSEFERSLWRIAKAMELHPEVKALTSVSWFHSPLLGQVFPRLSWMRDVFVNGGAYTVDLGPGSKSDICYNSVKRCQLYEAGEFCPRQTLMIWPRHALLSWAASHPELASDGESAISPPSPAAKRRLAKPAPMRRAAKQNSALKLWQGVTLLERSGAKYAAAVIIAPALALALAVAAALGWIAAIPALVMGLCAAYIFQYYFFQ